MTSKKTAFTAHIGHARTRIQQRARIQLKPCPLSDTILFYRTPVLLPLDGFGSAVPSFQLHPVFSAVSNRMPSGNAMLCFVGFGDKSWDNFKNFFQTQDVEFLFLSQRPRLAAFGGSIAPKMPVLKLSRPLACKPPAAIVSESARVACASCANPSSQVFAIGGQRELSQAACS